jgi:hypothetical protein
MNNLRECTMPCHPRPSRPALAVAAWVALGACAVALPGAAATCAVTSGPQTTAIVELYTSEGCSSCPPADRWLSATFPPGAAPPGAIPLAFHVDYWDRLGWTDRFAAAAYTQRQYAAMHAGRASFVYTPQVLVQGRDFSQWNAQARGAAAAIAAVNARPARAEITLEALPQPGSVAVKAAVRVPAAAERKGAAVHVALVDSRLASEVKAGENRGVRLVHDHVVRALRVGPGVDATGGAATEMVFALPAEAGRATTLVAFVQNPDTGDVLQAVALPLASCALTR